MINLQVCLEVSGTGRLGYAGFLLVCVYSFFGIGKAGFEVIKV